jgi:hypothetical protein
LTVIRAVGVWLSEIATARASSSSCRRRAIVFVARLLASAPSAERCCFALGLARPLAIDTYPR